MWSLFPHSDFDTLRSTFMHSFHLTEGDAVRLALNAITPPVKTQVQAAELFRAVEDVDSPGLYCLLKDEYHVPVSSINSLLAWIVGRREEYRPMVGLSWTDSVTGQRKRHTADVQDWEEVAELILTAHDTLKRDDTARMEGVFGWGTHMISLPSSLLDFWHSYVHFHSATQEGMIPVEILDMTVHIALAA